MLPPRCPAGATWPSGTRSHAVMTLIALATTLALALLPLSPPTAAAESLSQDKQNKPEAAAELLPQGKPATTTGTGGGTPPGDGIPDPTTASLEATNGPLTTAAYTVPNPSGYGSGTVTYPTSGGSYPGVVLMPGYRGTQQNLQWLAPRLASWGFVVINVGTNTLTDDPESRGRQITAAGTQLLALGNATGTPISGKLNGTLGAAGHSMGGGGVMAALRDDPRFRAGVPTAPYHTAGNFSGVTESHPLPDL